MTTNDVNRLARVCWYDEGSGNWLEFEYIEATNELVFRVHDEYPGYRITGLTNPNQVAEAMAELYDVFLLNADLNRAYQKYYKNRLYATEGRVKLRGV